MSRLAFLAARCWLDEDGQHVWTSHDCTAGRITTMLPWPKWSTADGKVAPSVNCLDCGAHYFGTIEQPEVTNAQQT